MSVFARRRLPLVILATLVLIGCSSKDEPATLGNILPDDTLAWLHLDDLPALETALDEYGLLELLVAELDQPEIREALQAELGLVLADDPRESIHTLLQDVRRADISVHDPLHQGDEEPVFVVHLECVDEAAAGRAVDLVREHADGEVSQLGFTALLIEADGDLTLMIGHTGAHVVLATEGERWGRIMGAVIDPPATGLVDTEDYQRVSDGQAHQIAIFVTPEFQDEMQTFFPMAPGINPASMVPLMEKYGSQHAFVGVDYRVTRLIARQAYEAGGRLAPLYVNPSGKSEFVKWMPAGTFFFDGGLVHDGPPKLELIRELMMDAMNAASGAAGGQMPPLPEDPFAAAEGTLGFSLFDLAERLREVAVAGAESPGWLLLMRARDEAAAQEVLEMFTGNPALGMLTEGEPVTVDDVTLRSFAWPGDSEARQQFIGRRGDTVMMVFQVAGAAAIEEFLAQIGDGALLASAPDHAKAQLGSTACGWVYVDLGGVLAAVGAGLDEELAEMPPALMQRLRTLKAAGLMTMHAGGVSEVVLELGAP